MEFYIIAEKKTTGLSDANTATCVFTTAYDGEVIIDIENKIKTRHIMANGKVSSGRFNKLISRLWLEGNLSVGYGSKLASNANEVFGLIFHQNEVEQALNLPISAVNIQKNNWYSGLFEPKYQLFAFLMLNIFYLIVQAV